MYLFCCVVFVYVFVIVMYVMYYLFCIGGMLIGFNVLVVVYSNSIVC